MTQSMNLTDVLRQIHQNADGEELEIGDIVKALESRGYGPLLLAPALLTVLPTGAIPGVPAMTALLIVFIAVQLVIGRESPWVPQKIAKRSIKKEKFERARKKAEPYLKHFDKFLKPRWLFLANALMIRILAGVCIVLAGTMPFLGLVPFGALVPAFAIAVIALGISAKDGAVIAVGLIFALAALGAAVYFLL